MKRLILSFAIAFGLAGSPSAFAETDTSIWRLFEGSRISDQITDKLNTEVARAAVSVATQAVTELFAGAGQPEADNVVVSEFVADTTPGSIDDPLEKYNRLMFEFNSRVDGMALRPIAESYTEYTPELVRLGVKNFFSNIGDVGVLANSVLQGNFDQALEDTSRLTINSTVGLAGVIDVATALDIEKNHEDFGQTLGVWGVPEGPYIVLPILGPRTARSAVGTAIDTYVQLETLGAMGEVAGAETAISEIMALNLIDQRSALLGKEDLLGKAALDPYLFAREAYVALRRCKVNNCDQVDYQPADSEQSADELDMLDELDLLDE